MRFAGKVVLVTGAARNTGLAIAEAFAREGALVALNDLAADDVARRAETIRAAGGAVLEVPADISKPDAVDAAFALVAREAGRLDVLVNNAAIQGVGCPLADTPRELLESVFRVNVFGAYDCARHAAGMMKEKGGGAIINISSNTALRAIRGRSAYVAAKGAIEALTRALAVELGPAAIRVNSIVAGYINTDRWASLGDQARLRRANIPLGREAAGADIAAAALFLASGAAAGITGAQLAVDGGCLAQLFPACRDR